MTGTIKLHSEALDFERAASNFARLMEHVANLYCSGESSSISTYEAHELATSVAYTLGIADATPEEATRVLDVEDPIALWHEGIFALEKRVDNALLIWQKIVAAMPPIRNVALRDTLASLSAIKQHYNAYFAAHEVPCDIDYQLSVPVDAGLMGIDYIEAWLSQLLTETRWMAQFDAGSCITVLEQACPDYRGLHVNLYDLLKPHESELAPSEAIASI